MPLLIFVAVVFVVAFLWSAVPVMAPLSSSAFHRSEAEVRQKCEQEGGMHIYQQVLPQGGRFPQIIPSPDRYKDWSNYGTVDVGYKVVITTEMIPSKYDEIEKKRMKIERIEDGFVLGENIYFSSTYPATTGLPRYSCWKQKGISEEKLVDAVFALPGEKTDPFPSCAPSEPTRLIVKSGAVPTPVKSLLQVKKWPPISELKSGIDCEQRTRIGILWDENISGDDSDKRVATTFQFLGQNGHRCLSKAMPRSNSSQVICTGNSIYILDVKPRFPKASNSTFFMQEYSANGQLIGETEIDGVAPNTISKASLVGYKETDNSITINSVMPFDSARNAHCYSVTIQKSNPNPNEQTKRVGPPDRNFNFPECQL